MQRREHVGPPVRHDHGGAGIPRLLPKFQASTSCRKSASIICGSIREPLDDPRHGTNRFACQKYWRRRAAYASQFLTPVDRAHRNIRRIEARLSPVNPHGEDDGCFYRPKGMRQATFERLWEELDRNEDVLNERLVRVAARLMKWAR